VQAARADAFARSWRGPVRVDGTAETFAEGIATRTTFDLTFTMLKTSLDDIVTLEESELQEGVSASIRCTHNLAEGAGGAAIAAARKTNLPGDARIVCVMSGGNADERTLRRALA
jgi:threonine dehydratase